MQIRFVMINALILLLFSLSSQAGKDHGTKEVLAERKSAPEMGSKTELVNSNRKILQLEQVNNSLKQENASLKNQLKESKKSLRKCHNQSKSTTESEAKTKRKTRLTDEEIKELDGHKEPGEKSGNTETDDWRMQYMPN